MKQRRWVVQKHVGYQLMGVKLPKTAQKRRVLQRHVVHHPVLNNGNGTKGKKQVNDTV
jgi:hypothetical protein